MQLCLARTGGDAQHPGGFLMAVAIDSIEDENVSCSFRQSVYRLRQVTQLAGITGGYTGRLLSLIHI